MVPLANYKSRSRHSFFVEKSAVARTLVAEEQTAFLVTKMSVLSRYKVISGNNQVIIGISPNPEMIFVNRNPLGSRDSRNPVQHGRRTSRLGLRKIIADDRCQPRRRY